MIGAPYDSDVASQAGAAYLFERDGDGRWIQMDKVVASTPDNAAYFSISLAIEGSTAVIGAEGADLPFNGAGGAYVFERDPVGRWHEIQKLDVPDPQGGEKFGT